MSSCSTAIDDGAANPALEPDTDAPAADGLALAQFAAGCFWSVELTYQRLPGVARTEVGYTQGHHQAPTYELVCGHGTGHAEAVRVHYDPKACPYTTLLDVFWAKINPTTLNRQGKDVGTQYRTGIYYYTAEQESLARASLAEQQKKWEDKIVTEILPAKRFYPAEEYHQRYLEKGGQSAEKGCTEPMRCYG
ncbi:peptide methionine sulfoxide reductase A2-1-like [Miscanthus floridulus]|uniref:peptide methionine sulfoxide reductase A2-1-like n=1 Tax=Miscanthus floridulus TaxID=154761 RepID=UPI003458C221